MWINVSSDEERANPDGTMTFETLYEDGEKVDVGTVYTFHFLNGRTVRGYVTQIGPGHSNDGQERYLITVEPVRP